MKNKVSSIDTTAHKICQTLVEKVFSTDKSAMLFDQAVRTIWSGEREDGQQKFIRIIRPDGH